MHSECLEELDLEDNLIGDSAGRELLDALEHRKEGRTEITIWASSWENLSLGFANWPTQLQRLDTVLKFQL